jgi:hypothetical protein
MFKSISMIPLLRKLNLSRNKLTEFFSDMLPEHNASLVFESQVFIYLEELYFAFNNVHSEAKLFYPVMQIPSLKYLVITGNPFAMRQDIGVSVMGTPTIGTNELSQTLLLILKEKGGQLINETLQPPTYMRREIS